MVQTSPTVLLTLLTTYGYGAIFACVALESAGLPLPGETMLLVAAITAGTTHQLSLPLVIAAAASGAVVGDNLGFWIGYAGGARLLSRLTRLVRRQERKVKVGLYLFHRHGGKVVFVGRFVTVLRMWAALMAGTAHMRWTSFLCWNAAGGLLWATGYGLVGYLLGSSVERFTGPVEMILLTGTLGAMVALFLLVCRYERRLEVQAVLLFPEPLEKYLGPAARGHGRANRMGLRNPAVPVIWPASDEGQTPTAGWRSAPAQMATGLVTTMTLEGQALPTEQPVPREQHASPKEASGRFSRIHLEPFSSLPSAKP